MQVEYYNAFSVLKHLFRKKDDEYIGMFEAESSVTPKIPFSDNRILGEVEFFIIENPFLKIEPPESRFPPGKPILLDGLFGKFVGSDYNFINVKEVRDLILQNCIEENKSKLLIFQGLKQPEFRIRYLLENNGEEEEEAPINQQNTEFLENLNPIDRHIYQLVYRSFRQVNLHLLQGALLGLECIFALLSFIEVIIQIRD